MEIRRAVGRKGVRRRTVWSLLISFGLFMMLALPSSAAAAGSITPFSAGLNANSDPRQIVNGPEGNLWFSDADGAIGRITPSGTITEFSTGINAHTDPVEIVVGSDGNLWFTDPKRLENGYMSQGTSAIGRITPSGTITEFSNGVNGEGEPISINFPASIVAGPEGNLWFTDDPTYSGGAPAIGRITPSGEITEFEVNAEGDPESVVLGPLVVGPDNNLWFTMIGPGLNRGDIGRITPSGTITEFSTSEGATARLPGDIVSGPDGSLWFTSFTPEATPSGYIGRITPTGTVTEFSTGVSTGSIPERLTVGPEGNLWFTDSEAKAIGRATPSGNVTEFPIYPNPVDHYDERPPATIITGPDGNLWFTLYEGFDIGRITPSGFVTLFSTGLLPETNPESITVGPSGSDLWMTAPGLEGTSSIDRIAPVGPAGVSPEPTLNVVTEGSGSGTVSSAPAGISCSSSCSGQFGAGATVTLTATAAAGSTFAGWGNAEERSEEVPPACIGTAACDITIRGDSHVTAVFETQGGGNPNPSPAPTPTPQPTPTPHKKLKCHKGFKKHKVHGKAKCVKVHKGRHK